MGLTCEFVLEMCKKGKTQKEIAAECGCSQSWVCEFCKRHDIEPPRRPAANRVDLTGKKCGKLTIISYDKTVGSVVYWLCRCDCGKEKSVNGKHLKKCKVQSCGCKRYEPSRNRGGWEEIPANYINDLRKKADSRGIAFSITPEIMWQQFIKQDRICALTGVELCFPKNRAKRFRSSQTASLDRTDSSKGYSADNIQWVHKRINLMKHHLATDEFISWCCKVVLHQIDGCS